MDERNWEVYKISKLKKFMEMVKFAMQVIGFIILNYHILLSTRDYSTYLELSNYIFAVLTI